MAVSTPDFDPQPEREVYSWEQMREMGLLWLINRVVFHPRGFALALEYVGGDDEPCGWSIVGDGSEVWTFPPDKFDEDDLLRRVEGLLDRAREHGRAPKSTPSEDRVAPEPQEHLTEGVVFQDPPRS